MFNFIKLQAIMSLVTMLIKKVDPEMVEKMADKALDFVEDNFSEHAAVMAACNLVREAFNIEDNDELQ